MSSKTFDNTKINVEFDEDYQSRININSGENISSLFAKIRRFILDLKSVAFSGSYNDLSDTQDVATKEYVDPIKSLAAINRTTLGTQCKNLFKVTVVSQTAYGVTFTVNADKSITVNGTATQNIYLNMGSFYFEAGKQYILNGCPSGGSKTKYFLAYDGMPGHQYDTGSGTTFSVSESATKPMLLVIKSGQTVSNLTFKPMLRYADITDDTYEPYKENVNERLIEDKSNITINKSTLGYQRKNILDETGYLSSITSVTRGTKSISGNQITLTATADNCFTNPHTSSDGGYRIPVEPDTDYILSWESDNTYAGLVYVFMNGNTSNYKNANNKVSKYIKFTTNSDTTFITIRLAVATSGNSITYSNIMLRYADILDDTYEPYQPSVREQTGYSLSVSGKSTSAAISYNGVPTLICLTPNTADSTTGGLYMINSAGAVVKLIEKTGVVVAAASSSKTFTITNNTSTVIDVCISRCWGR